MPTPFRRIGLVLDQEVDGALELFREGVNEEVPQASLARRAVFEGALVQALVLLARQRSPAQARAAAVVREMRELLPSLSLPREATDDLTEVLAGVAQDDESEARRQRQRTLLESPNLHGAAALSHAEDFDLLDSVPR
ncbi:MAG TPA: hypothetical protein VNB64_05935 [Solirubrobacteraceae bacterium]|nr:hypothetical protein [Solirubrobacteraceae bacterium]